jgi:hypothetical protein
MCSSLSHASNQSHSINTEPTLYNRIAADTTNFHCKLIDFDHDGNLDKVYWNQYISGDSLFIFKNTGADYECSLKTINFSADGIYEVDDVGEVVENGVNYLVVRTHFNGAGGQLQTIYLSYKQKSRTWKVSHTIVQSSECLNEHDCYEKTCKILQNIELNENTKWDNYRSINEARKKECMLVKK